MLRLVCRDIVHSINGSAKAVQILKFVPALRCIPDKKSGDAASIRAKSVRLVVRKPLIVAVT